MPPKPKSDKEKQKMVSARYAAMYVPNTRWDFFDAYMNSQPCVAARSRQEISTEGGNLHKYIKLTYQNNQLEKERRDAIGRVHLPTLLTDLLALQSASGRFEDLEAVLRVLHMPSTTTLRNANLYSGWEVATSFAVAAMRQEIYLFDQLVEAHDRAVQWLTASELVPEAREVIHNLMGARDDPAQLAAAAATAAAAAATHAAVRSGGCEEASSRSADDAAGAVEDEDERERVELRRQMLKQQRQILSTRIALSRSGTASSDFPAPRLSELTAATEHNAAHQQQEQPWTHHFASEGGKDGGDDQQHQHGQVKAAAMTVNVFADDASGATEEDIMESLEVLDTIGPPPSSPLTPSGANLVRLKSKLEELTISRDEYAIAAQQKVVDAVKVEIIDIYLHIEKLTLALIDCMHRCIKKYINCEKNRDRYVQFNELTCRLGEGKAGQAGFDDWRQHGVPGLRPWMLRFFNAVQRMAEERMLLQELENPAGVPLDKNWKAEELLSKWKLIWNGQDLVHKVIHCLDFLRKCRELSEWYGPSYYFTANPLTLPLPMARVCSSLRGVDELIRDQRQSLPHKRLGIMNVADKRGWQHEQFLNRFRRDFQHIEEERVFNWPTMPQVREERDNEQMFTALLVMFVTHKDHLEETYKAEKSLISKLASKRGQEKYLIGVDTARVDRKLFLPPMEKRQQRPADPIQASNRANHPRLSHMSGRSTFTAGVGGSGMGSRLQRARSQRLEQSSQERDSSDLQYTDSQTLVGSQCSDDRKSVALESSVFTAETTESAAARPHLQRAANFHKMVDVAQQENVIAAAAIALLRDNTAPAVTAAAAMFDTDEKSLGVDLTSGASGALLSAASSEKLRAADGDRHDISSGADQTPMPQRPELNQQQEQQPQEQDQYKYDEEQLQQEMMESAHGQVREERKASSSSGLGLRVRSADEIPPDLLVDRKKSIALLKRANSEKAATAPDTTTATIASSLQEKAATSVRPLLVQDRRRRAGPAPSPSATPIPTPSGSSKGGQLPVIAAAESDRDSGVKPIDDSKASEKRRRSAKVSALAAADDAATAAAAATTPADKEQRRSTKRKLTRQSVVKRISSAGSTGVLRLSKTAAAAESAPSASAQRHRTFSNVKTDVKKANTAATTAAAVSPATVASKKPEKRIVAVDLQNIARAASRHKKRMQSKSTAAGDSGVSGESSQSDASADESTVGGLQSRQRHAIAAAKSAETPAVPASYSISSSSTIKKRVSISENSIRSKDSSVNEQLSLSAAGDALRASLSQETPPVAPNLTSLSAGGSIETPSAGGERSHLLGSEGLLDTAAAGSAALAGHDVGSIPPPPSAPPPGSPGTPLRSALAKGGKRKQPGDSPLITRFKLDHHREQL